MNAIATIDREFNGSLVSFMEREGASLWLDAEQLAACLGYTSAEGVRRLANRHEDEVAPFRSRVKVTRDRGTSQTTAEVVIFEERAIYLLACLAKTEKAAKFLVDREEWERSQDFSAALLTAYEKQADAMAKVASTAGYLLGLRRRTKPKWDPRQSLIPGVVFEELPAGEADAPKETA